MLLDRLQRPVRGVRIVRKPQSATEPNGIQAQIIPYRRLEKPDVARILDRVKNTDGPVVTSALAPSEQTAFRALGFVDREPLHLLRHGLQDLETWPAARQSRGTTNLRAGRRSDIKRVLDIDQQSFDDFWVFDREALNSARRATPVHRFRVTTHERTVVGYAITGRSGRSSFLQRLGVDPASRGAGLGTELVNDALRWAVNDGASSMLVNTQVSNSAALSLYQSCGFSLSDDQLMVLQWQP